MLNTGVLHLKSSCLLSIIVFLQNIKKIITNIKFATPRGIKKMSIWKIFINIMILTIGPYTVSMITKAKVLSKIPKSFENLFISLPEGVTSK